MLTFFKFKLTPLASAVLLTLPSLSDAEIILNNGHVNIINQIPVIDINKPNINGISHNIYNKMDIDSKGAVFNNSTVTSATTSQSQLAGKLAANPNMGTTGAKIILNEIQSNQATQLNGALEVFGDKARVIISNPSGITCSSCSFIGNNEDVTLTTGSPRLVFNQLNGYDTTKGNILIKGSLTSNSPTAIISQTANIQGDITVTGVKGLTIITGSNFVKSDNTTYQATNNTKSNQTYGIDVSAFGGMYADKITLISTENGVGIRNSGTLSAGTGGLTLNSNGTLINSSATLQSKGDIQLSSSNGLNNDSGTINAAKSIAADTQNSLLSNRQGGVISSSGDISLNSRGLDNTNGRISASGSLYINSGNIDLLNKSSKASEGIYGNNIQINSTAKVKNIGTIKGKMVDINADLFFQQYGSIDATDDIEIQASNSIINHTGRIRSDNGGISLKANQIRNRFSTSLDIDSKDSLGIIAGAGGLTVESSLFSNESQVYSVGDIDIKTTNAFRNYDNYADNDIYGTRVSITGSGTLKSKGDINIQSNSVDNYYGNITTEKSISINTPNNIKNDFGKLQASQDINFNTGTLSNLNGEIAADNDISYIGLNSLSSKNGIIEAKHDVSINASDIDNTQAKISAGNNLDLMAINKISNSDGYINSDLGLANLFSASIDNRYGLIKSKDIYIETTGDINNDSGFIKAKNGINMQIHGSISNNSSLYFGHYSGGYLGLKGQNGGIVSGNDITLRANALTSTSSRIEATNGNIDIDITGNFNNSSSQFNSGGDMIMNVINMNNNNGTIHAGGNIVSRFNSYSNQSDSNISQLASGAGNGRMDSEGNLRMDIFGQFNNLSAITANNNLDLRLYGSVTNKGYISSNQGDLSLDVHNNLTNNGTITGNKQLNLKLLPISTIDNYGTINANGNLDIKAGYLTNRNGAVISANKTLNTNNTAITSENGSKIIYPK